MSSFAFLPRSISRQKTESHKSRVSGDVAGPSIAPPGKVLAPSANQSAKATALKDEELLSLLDLSLSDYALWCAPDLQYRMKMGQDGCQ